MATLELPTLSVLTADSSAALTERIAKICGLPKQAVKLNPNVSERNGEKSYTFAVSLTDLLAVRHWLHFGPCSCYVLNKELNVSFTEQDFLTWELSETLINNAGK